MKPVRILPLLALLGAGVVPLPAQEAAAARPQTVIFTIQDLSVGGDTRDYQDPITASVSAAFAVGGFDVVAPQKWQQEAQRANLEPRALLAEADALAVARAVGADVAVTGYYAVESDRIYVSLQCWDVAAGVVAAGLQQAARFNLAFYSALHDQVAEMLPQVHVQAATASAAGPGPAGGAGPASKQPLLPEVTFLSPDEGMEVFLAGGTRLGTVKAGRLTWQAGGVAPGYRFQVEKRKRGYHTGVETVKAAREVRLRGMVAEKSKAAEIDWTFGQLAGAGGTLRGYFAPDSSFFSVSSYIYVQPPLTSAGFPVFHVDGAFGIGSYVIFPADSWVRLGVSTGMGMVITGMTGPAGGTYADPYWNVLSWWIETRVLGPIIFLRQEWKFTLGGGLLGLQPMLVANVPPFTLGVVFRW